MSRRKVIIQARELSEMDVSRVSLVKRGANRIPFRIVKSDGESKMSGINLSNLFLRKREVAPAILAIVLSKDADVEVYSKALTEAGFEIDHVDEGEEVNTLMLSADALPEDVSLYKCSDDAALILGGIQKGLQSWPESNSFVENITTAGFMPSFRLAHDILGETVRNIAFSEGDAEMTKSSISKAMTDFSGYIEAVMSTVPEQAFKTDELIVAVEKGLLNEQDTATSLKQKAKDSKKQSAKDKKDTKKDDGSEAEATPAIAAEIVALTDDVEKQTAIAALIAVKSDDKGEAESDETPATEASADTETTDEDETDANAALMKSISETIAAAVAPLTESVAGVKQELSDRLDGLEAQVKKTDEALNGSTNSEEADDEATPVKKSGEGNPVIWDNVLDFGDVEIV